MSSADKNPNRVAGGLKATINNPNISEETKQDAKERLDNFDSQEVGSAPSTKSTRNDSSATGMQDVEDDVEDAGYTQQQLGGFKAALHRDGTSEEAKERARNALASAGESEEPIN